ncbi:MAG: hypothetical protein EBR82_86160 [Caulobacteraceae bacterium]|nr:hypothetical protein [Caulobacteraceae bacterium]
MKKQIKSLLGIEMSLGQREFKPLLLLIGVLLFILMVIPIGLSLFYYKLKNTLYISWGEIKKNKRLTKYKGVKWV